MTAHVANTKELNNIKSKVLTTNGMVGILVNAIIVLLFFLLNPIYVLFFCALLNLTSLRINYWVFSFMFALSFALMFFLKDYSLANFPNNSDVVIYIEQFKHIHNLSWSEIFYRFISFPNGNEPLFWSYYKVAWILFSGNTTFFVFFHFFITFGLIAYLAKIVDANKFVIVVLCVLFARFSMLITLFQIWRHTIAFLLLLIGILLFDFKKRKWFPRIIIYSTILIHISTAVIVVIFEFFIFIIKKSNNKLYFREILGYTSFMVLVFIFVAKFSLLFAKRFNLDVALTFYFQNISTIGSGIDLLNWFTLLICMFLWLNRKKLTNTDLFIASQYFVISVLFINIPVPDIFGRYNYYIFIGGAILIGKLIATANFKLSIILLIFLFSYDIYNMNYSTELINSLSYRLYGGYLNPAYGLTAMILNYDTILSFNF